MEWHLERRSPKVLSCWKSFPYHLECLLLNATECSLSSGHYSTFLKWVDWLFITKYAKYNKHCLCRFKISCRHKSLLHGSKSVITMQQYRNKSWLFLCLNTLTEPVCVCERAYNITWLRNSVRFLSIYMCSQTLLFSYPRIPICCVYYGVQFTYSTLQQHSSKLSVD